MNEVEFSQLIDCNFPYDDRCSAETLIEKAKSISPPAMFMVLEEICRPPKGNESSTKVLLDLIDSWERYFDHPLKAPVAQAARIMARNSTNTVAEAIVLMDQVAQFRGYHSALNIAYFSCNDRDGMADLRANDIRSGWEK